MVFKGVSVVINCTTNDPDAVVTLIQKSSGSATGQNALVAKGARMTQKGQAFVLNPVKSEDANTYECTASNALTTEIVLVKGQLSVNARECF